MDLQAGRVAAHARAASPSAAALVGLLIGGGNIVLGILVVVRRPLVGPWIYLRCKRQQAAARRSTSGSPTPCS